MSIQIDCHGETHVGLHRPSNEDQFLIADLNKSMRVHQTSLGLNHQTRLFGGSQGKLMLVADGLGGHNSGERASTLAVDGITNYILNTMDWVLNPDQQSEANFKTGLCEALRHSQDALHNEADAIPQRRGMATTLTMAYIDWPILHVVHVGDTRCYLIRGKDIKCLTTDHTIGELVRSASRHEERHSNETRGSESDMHPIENSMNHALYNVIGGVDQALNPQISRCEMQVGDALLLCSDGLTRYISDDEIQSSIQKENACAKKICEGLVDEANARGGKDNITVVLAKFQKPGQTECVDVHAQVSRQASAELDMADLCNTGTLPMHQD